MKSQRGYSLIEIAIGLAIILIFLVSTGSLINASYTNYRLVLQRNEAMDIAIKYMENVLLESGDSIREMARALPEGQTQISYVGYQENNMEAIVKIEKVKEGNNIYGDKVFLVTVDVLYAKTANSDKKYHVELKSLKVIE